MLVGACRLVGEGLNDGNRLIASSGCRQSESIIGGIGNGDVEVDDTRGGAGGELAVELLVLVAE